MAKPTIRTPEKDAAFFDAVAAGAPIGDAGKSVGYARQTLYDWRNADPEFKARWDASVHAAIERMEREADRRAIDGTLKPVFYQGVECGQVREYSDTLLIFRLKALDPAKYRERASVEHTGADGKDLIPPEAISGDKLALALLHSLRAAQAGKTEKDGAE